MKHLLHFLLLLLPLLSFSQTEVLPDTVWSRQELDSLQPNPWGIFPFYGWYSAVTYDKRFHDYKKTLTLIKQNWHSCIQPFNARKDICQGHCVYYCIGGERAVDCPILHVVYNYNLIISISISAADTQYPKDVVMYMLTTLLDKVGLGGDVAGLPTYEIIVHESEYTDFLRIEVKPKKYYVKDELVEKYCGTN